MDEETFSTWYSDVIDRAGLSDKRYPIKGMNVWRPYGLKIMRHIDAAIRALLDGTGHDEVSFPLLISEEMFAKESDHIQGFESDVFWVTHGGLNELDVRLLLRPTSETAMYPMFALWIRSHADLPLKTYQIVNTFRYETKMTRSFIRVREIHFFEAHTAHVDFDDAQRQIEEDLEIWAALAKELCLPYYLSKRPEWDKFAGAFYTIGIDTLMPTDRVLQLGSIHHYRDNFAKPYDVKYEDESGTHHYVHQTTYGMSERLVGAIIAVHGDAKGLVLPPAIAPYQAVIVPILVKARKDEVTESAKELAMGLGGIRVHLDDRDITPGAKYHHWELRGVPLRIELGPRDLDSGVVVVVARDTGEKTIIPRAELPGRLFKMLDAYRQRLTDKATAAMAGKTLPLASLNDVPEHQGLFSMGWCGSEECGKRIEETLDQNVLGIPQASTESVPEDCIACGTKAENLIHTAKTY